MAATPDLLVDAKLQEAGAASSRGTLPSEKPLRPPRSLSVLASPSHSTPNEFQSLAGSPPSPLGSESPATIDAATRYHRVRVEMDHEAKGAEVTSEMAGVCEQLRRFVGLRRKYVYEAQQQYESDSDSSTLLQGASAFQRVHGVYRVTSSGSEEAGAAGAQGAVPASNLFPVPSQAEFYQDLKDLWTFCASGPANTFCWNRLQVLRKHSEFYAMLNWSLETAELRTTPVDFYECAKVDNHIHLAGAMTATHLLRFIKSRLPSPEIVNVTPDGTRQTLRDVLVENGLDPDRDLTVDRLNVMADRSHFHRFDNFNQAYNPFDIAVMRSIFLKTKSFQNGAYFAQLAEEIFARTLQEPHIFLEPRVSIYGRQPVEWDHLADWIYSNKLNEFENVVWLVQIPRIYHLWRSSEAVKSFDEWVGNIFDPLFEATLDPASHPNLARLLDERLAGFDSVDDESKSHAPPQGVQGYPNPEEWTDAHPPSYSYYSFYIWANLTVLNRLRESMGKTTFQFRPHGGEAGSPHHLATTFLLANSINHGIKLKDNPTLCYLYYLCQIGLSISPQSNNLLFTPLEKNPFETFFRIGLNVTLSTDDPLQFHHSSDPLIEEYTIAKQHWKLSVADVCEIAKNSVLQSGFADEVKERLLGPQYYLPGASGNDPAKSNIPQCRMAFRRETLDREVDYVVQLSNAHLLQQRQQQQQQQRAQKQTMGQKTARGISSSPSASPPAGALQVRPELVALVAGQQQPLPESPGAWEGSAGPNSRSLSVRLPAAVRESAAAAAAAGQSRVAAAGGGAPARATPPPRVRRARSTVRPSPRPGHQFGNLTLDRQLSLHPSYVVVHDYNQFGHDKGCLVLRKGDHVHLASAASPSPSGARPTTSGYEMWFGRRDDGVSGWFPSNVVEVTFAAGPASLSSTAEAEDEAE